MHNYKTETVDLYDSMPSAKSHRYSVPLFDIYVLIQSNTLSNVSN